MPAAFFAHETAVIDAGATIGDRTRIWHFSHVMAGAVVGKDCTLGQNVFVAKGAKVGDRVKIQNNVSVYDGVVLEDDVFCGPSSVFTNVRRPRSEVSRKHAFETTVVRKGATIGANATIVCGSTIGRYATIGAGAVVARSQVPDYALMVGVPATRTGWVGRHGCVLERESDGTLRCPESGLRYREDPPGVVRCLDVGEHEPLPGEQ